MKLSEIPWPGDVIASNFEDSERFEELAIRLPHTPHIMTIYAGYYGNEDNPEISIVVRKLIGNKSPKTMIAAYDFASVTGRDIERDPECSRFDIPSIFELLAAVDYFAQKYGANPPE